MPPLRRLSTLILLATAGLGAAAPPPAAATPAPEETTEKKASALSLLPHGSVLEDVILPRYDEQRRILNALKIGVLTLVDDDSVDGRPVAVEFFETTGKLRGRIDLAQARFHQSAKRLRADESVTILFDRFAASGNGLVFYQQRSEGFLGGPLRNWIFPQALEIPMKPISSTLLAATLPTLALANPAPQSATPANPPQPPTFESAAPELRQSLETSRQQLRADLEAANQARASADAFLQETDLPALPPRQPNAAEPPSPPDDSPSPDFIQIDCDGGQYFSIDKGRLLYLGNVRVDHPDFQLEGANEVQILFAPKDKDENTTPGPSPTPDPAGEPEKTDRGFDTSRFQDALGDLDRIVASGTLLIRGKATDTRQAMEASGALLTYDAKNKRITLSGGKPWITRGREYVRATRDSAILTIQENGEFSFDGPSQTRILTESLRKSD